MDTPDTNKKVNAESGKDAEKQGKGVQRKKPAPPAEPKSAEIKDSNEMPDLDEFSFFKW